LATLVFAYGEFTAEIVRGGELIIDMHDLRLVVVVRALEAERVLIEFGVPRGNRTLIALGA
jgi:hypothetical protein